MNDIVYLFDGQGAFVPGMGKELYRQYEPVRQVFRKINGVIGEELEAYCFGKKSSAAKSNNTWIQLTITAINLSYAALLQSSGLEPALSLGHSLGEISAVISSGAVSLEDGIRIVRQRGILMNEAARLAPGDMLVINGATATEVRQLVREEQDKGNASLCPANINGPVQITVSGRINELKAFQFYLMKNRPALKTQLLNVGGAWHNPLLQQAAVEFKSFLETIPFSCPVRPFFSVTRQQILDEPAAIQSSLAEQLVKEVDWVAAIETVKRAGHRRLLEVGPGKILYGLVTRIAQDLACKPICWVKNPAEPETIFEPASNVCGGV